MKKLLLSSLVIFDLLLLSCAGGEPADTRPPDVLLVVLDTLRADHVSSYGYSRPTTLQIDALARFGVSFDNVITSGSWTYPNHASLFTGEYPWTHGAHLSPFGGLGGDTSKKNLVTSLRKDLPTLAQKFSDAGYRTVAITSNGWLSEELGLVRGFDLATCTGDETAMEDAIREIKAHYEDDKPLFLFVNIMPAHSPYFDLPGKFQLEDQSFLDPETAPEWIRPYLLTGELKGVEMEVTTAEGDPLPGQTHFIRGDFDVSEDDLAAIRHLYDTGVHTADFYFKRLFSVWSERERESIVVVTSDHGEALGERGHIGHIALIDPEILHVPLVIVAPNKIPTGVRVSEPVQWRDLHPTLLDLAGIEQGDRSLLPLIQGKKRTSPPILAKAWRRLDWAYDVGGRYNYDWHLYQTDDFALHWNGRKDEGLQVKLYDLKNDPTMQENIADSKPEKVSELLKEAREAFAHEVASEIQQISPDLRKKLEAMGYIQE